jgi:hypothetical protein
MSERAPQLPADLTEAMAAAFYEAEKHPGSTLPPWSRVEPTYQRSIRRGITGAIAALHGAGFKIEKAG